MHFKSERFVPVVNIKAIFFHSVSAIYFFELTLSKVYTAKRNFAICRSTRARLKGFLTCLWKIRNTASYEKPVYEEKHFYFHGSFSRIACVCPTKKRKTISTSSATCPRR